jgi:transcriptional regulator with XRE-family HTH domain
MLINPKTIRQLRERAGMSQKQLAEHSMVAARTIQRIETSEGPYSCRPHQAKNLAKALHTTPVELAGGNASDSELAKRLKQIGWKPLQLILRQDFRFYTDMIERIYGVTMRDVVELAPLLFVMVAERSLAERRAAAREMQAALDALTPQKGHPQLAFMHYTGEFGDALERERQSIAAKDIFASDISEFAAEVAEIDESNNPFIETIKRMVADCGSDVIEMHTPSKEWPLSIDVGLFERQLEHLTGGDPMAVDALTGPEARRIGDIPDELHSDERREDRIRWLIDQVSEDRRKDLEQQAADLELLLGPATEALDHLKGSE